MLFGECRQHLTLVQGDSHRLFGEQIDAVLKAPDPGVVHDVRWTNRVHRVRSDLLDHGSVVGVSPADAIGIPGLVTPRGVKITDGGQLDAIQPSQRRVMDPVRHPAGANHRDPHQPIRRSGFFGRRCVNRHLIPPWAHEGQGLLG
jgi:hypothetical protein